MCRQTQTNTHMPFHAKTHACPRYGIIEDILWVLRMMVNQPGVNNKGLVSGARPPLRAAHSALHLMWHGRASCVWARGSCLFCGKRQRGPSRPSGKRRGKKRKTGERALGSPYGSPRVCCRVAPALRHPNTRAGGWRARLTMEIKTSQKGLSLQI